MPFFSFIYIIRCNFLNSDTKKGSGWKARAFFVLALQVFLIRVAQSLSFTIVLSIAVLIINLLTVQ